jgi:nicotinate dehydrogenase subunit B
VNQDACPPLSRSGILNASGVLCITRQALPQPAAIKGQPSFIASDPSESTEVLLAVWRTGKVIALHGHVDLGTGLRTALTQVVAEELDMLISQVEMVMGSTSAAPNQGATIASASLQVHAEPLRRAAGQARDWLIKQLALRWQCDPDQIQVTDGFANYSSHTARLTDAVPENACHLVLDLQAPVKPPHQYKLVGQPIPRIDIPAKATGMPAFVHDLQWPGVLHGRVIRPPYAGADHGEFIGKTLESVQSQSVAHIPGVRAVVVQGDFVGVVAEREEHAEQAMHELEVRWKSWPSLPPVENLENALRSNPSTPRELVNEGQIEKALQQDAEQGVLLERTYIWPYQLHASLGPSCALADWMEEGDPQQPQIKLRVWAGTQNPHVLRRDLALLTNLQDIQIEVIRMEAAGCYGRNGADDVAADAALLSKTVKAPVRVQLSREQENAWEPKGAAQWMQVSGGLDANNQPNACDFQTSYPSNGAPTLALLLTGTVAAQAQTYEMGDRTARPPYSYGNLRVTVHDMPPILRASWLRGVSALPNSFAHESFIDELAAEAGADPVEFRLRHLADPRAQELIRATANRAGWLSHFQPQQQAAKGEWLQGQGFAYARYIHSKWPGFGAAWAAWVADVEVHRQTGEVHVKRVVVGHDAGLTINPAGVEHQIHGNVIQATSRALKEKVKTDGINGKVVSNEWGSYPVLSFREVPVIEVMQMPRPGEPALGAGESSSVPGTAAIANALFDATGIRFRQPPFTPEVVRAALNPLPAPAPQASNAKKPKPFRIKTSQIIGLVTGLVTAVTALIIGGLDRPIQLSKIVRPDTSQYSSAQIDRGRQLAALGNCAGCHTSPEGERNAGGLAMETRFGVIYSTNITPDSETGIGGWSYRAFERAMREGVSRDGHLLYPAFPYTAFASLAEEDMMALYAYLQSQPAVRQTNPETRLAFPFSQRYLMQAWNRLFHNPAVEEMVVNPEDSVSRGAYWVNTLGHCGSCHTERNFFGAERKNQAYLQGAMVDGWHAPALNQLNPSPVPWTANAFYNYLRHGHSPDHAVAGGPMAQIVRELQAVPDETLRDIANYLASLNPATESASPTAIEQMRNQVVQLAARQAPLPDAAQRQFEGSCGACHHDGDGPKLLGVNTPLALNSQLHSDQPDNLIRTILDGLQAPPSRQVGFMPGFRNSLTDQQIADIVGYMRRRYAPERDAWLQLSQQVARVRAKQTSTHIQ